MFKTKRIISLLVLITISVHLHGQQLNFRYIGNKIELPVNECYNITQSKDGYIWISTEAGLCVYNGVNCKLQLSSPVYANYKDANGSINFITNNHEIYEEKDDTLFQKSAKENPLNLFSNKHTLVYDVISLDTGIIYSGQSETVFYPQNEHKGLLLRGELRDTCLNFFYSKNNLFQVKGETSIIKEIIKKKKKVSIRVNKNGKTIQLSIPFTENIDSYWRILCANKEDGTGYIAIGNQLIQINNNHSIEVKKFPDRILSLTIGKNSGLWVGVSKSGLYYFESNLTQSIQSLKGYSVTSLLEDQENNIWCTTLEKGVFYVENKNVITYNGYSVVNGKCDFIKNIEGTIFASSSNGTLIKIKGSNCETFDIPSLKNYSIQDIISYKEGYVLAGNQFIAYVDRNFNLKNIYSFYGTNYNAGATSLCNHNNNIISSHYTGLKVLFNKSFKLISPLNFPSNVLYHNGSYYVAEKGGIKAFDTSDFKLKNLATPKKNFKKLLVSINKTLLALTTEGEIYEIKQNNTANLVSSLKSSGTYFYDLDQAPSGDIWIATNKGIYRLNNKFTLKYLYTNIDGIPTNEVNKICCNSNMVFYSTIEGLGSIYMNSITNNLLSPKLELKEVIINNIPRSKPDTAIELPQEECSLKLNFDVLTFRKKNNSSVLFYTIQGTSEPGIIKQYRSESQLIFDNLRPDTYILKVYGVNDYGNTSKNPVVLTIHVPPPYWQTIGFITLIALLLLISVAFISYFIIRKIKKREQEKSRINKLMAEYQLTALQSQMNPHFIFNSINSIQNFILQKREKDAYTYLSKFAKLVRMVLHNSQKKNILLTEEINLIKTYIETEKMRFDDSFDFTLSVDDELREREIILPPMLLQPYIENAIWHGLMHLENERKGQLMIKFRAEGEILKIIIEDNGIGRKRSEKYREENHLSVAMNLNKKRIDLMKSAKLMNGHISIDVQDLYDSSGNATGTRVNISLPLEESM